MKLPKKIEDALIDDTNSIYQWIILLNHFEDYFSILSKKQKIRIHLKCEEIRVFNNTPQKQFIERRGEKTFVMSTPLDIKKDEVQPQSIYTDEVIIQYYRQQERTTVPTHIINMITWFWRLFNQTKSTDSNKLLVVDN